MSLSKAELTDAQIDAVWQRMNGDTEWLRTFGYQQFAQAILDAVAPDQDSSATPCADPIVERNVSLLRQRSTVGVQKYGTTLADNKLPLRAWLNHALEEALDQANYLQAAMAEIDSAERVLPPLPQYFPDVTNIRADEELRAQQYAQDYARSALAASPAQALTNKEIELAIALGKAQGTLRFIATVSKDKHIAEKAWEAATASPDAVPAAQGDALAEREKFEKHFGPKDNFCWRNADDTYKNASTQQAWEVWQAAVTAKAAPTPQ